MSKIHAALIAQRLALSPILLLLCWASARAQEAPTASAKRYRAEHVNGMTTIRELQKTYGAGGFQAILHLNRLDLAHVRDGGTLDRARRSGVDGRPLAVSGVHRQ